MQDYVDKLQLPLRGKLVDDNTYKIDFLNSDMFEKFYLIFSRYDFLTFDEDASSITLEGANLSWTDDEGYQIVMQADYDKDEYFCTITKEA